MKKIILLLITLTTLTNVSYASFPISVQPVISIDTIIPDTNKIMDKETTSEYHSRMQKEGFDIDNCMCESCSKNGKMKGSKFTTPRLKNVLFFLIILTIFILIIFLIRIGERGPEGSRSNFDFQDWWDSP